jgi:hypothetical protein
MSSTVSHTNAAEGAIHFRYRLAAPIGDVQIDRGDFERLRAWRMILKRLKLIGRDARRYDGYAYGNLSVRDANTVRFFITATQTSDAPRLRAGDLVRVDAWDADRFEVVATGTRAPSSESITHGMLYEADPSIRWVMHVHAPVIWSAAARLDLPTTGAEVAYGSQAMAASVAALLARHRARPLLFATLGHGDGVFVCGGTANDTGTALVRALADATSLEHRQS